VVFGGALEILECRHAVVDGLGVGPTAAVAEERDEVRDTDLALASRACDYLVEQLRTGSV
jgi:hypothetical protein